MGRASRNQQAEHVITGEQHPRRRILGRIRLGLTNLLGKGGVTGWTTISGHSLQTR